MVPLFLFKSFVSLAGEKKYPHNHRRKKARHFSSRFYLNLSLLQILESRCNGPYHKQETGVVSTKITFLFCFLILRPTISWCRLFNKGWKRVKVSVLTWVRRLAFVLICSRAWLPSRGRKNKSCLLLFSSNPRQLSAACNFNYFGDKHDL